VYEFALSGSSVRTGTAPSPAQGPYRVRGAGR
jgi:hypothetical protein